MGYDERQKHEGDWLGCKDNQKHVHELVGSVKIAEEEEDPHNHRFATVTGEAMPLGANDHFHEVCFNTDFFDEHFHEFKGRTGGAIKVDDEHHVHFIESVTSMNDGHRHAFEAATLIDNPIEKELKHKKEDCKNENYRNENYRNENYRNTGYNRNRYR